MAQIYLSRIPARTTVAGIALAIAYQVAASTWIRLGRVCRQSIGGQARAMETTGDHVAKASDHSEDGQMIESE